MRNSAFLEHRHRGGDRIGIGADLPTRWKVVTGSTFVAYCGVGDNDVTERQSRNDRARTAAGDELPAAGGNRVLKESAGQWGPDAWMEHSNVATPDVQPQRLYQR